MGGDEGRRVREDLVGVLHDGVRWQPAVLHRQRHRPAGGMEPHPEGAGGGYLGGDEVPTAAGVDVQVVGGSGAATERQLGQTHIGGDVRGLLVQPRPPRVQRPQPVEQRGGQGGCERPGQVLEDVMMGVDQAGCDQAAGRLQRPPGHRDRVARPADGADEPPRHRDPAAWQLAAPVVDGRDEFGAAHEQVDRWDGGSRRGRKAVVFRSWSTYGHGRRFCCATVTAADRGGREVTAVGHRGDR